MTSRRPAHAGLDHSLGETIDLIRDTVRQFSSQEIAPRAEEIDRTDAFPRDLWPRLGDLGLLGIICLMVGSLSKLQLIWKM